MRCCRWWNNCVSSKSISPSSSATELQDCGDLFHRLTTPIKLNHYLHFSPEIFITMKPAFSSLVATNAAGEDTTRLYMLTTEVGFDELIPLTTLKDPSAGFLLEDSCIFGAEVFPFKFNGRGESISMMKDSVKNTFTWNIPYFTQVAEENVKSSQFHIGGHNWKLKLYPNGNRNIAKGESISLYLFLVDDLLSDRKVLAKFIFRIRGNHISEDKQMQCSLFKFYPAHAVYSSFIQPMQSLSVILFVRHSCTRELLVLHSKTKLGRPSGFYLKS